MLVAQVAFSVPPASLDRGRVSPHCQVPITITRVSHQGQVPLPSCIYIVSYHIESHQEISHIGNQQQKTKTVILVRSVCSKHISFSSALCIACHLPPVPNQRLRCTRARKAKAVGARRIQFPQRIGISAPRRFSAAQESASERLTVSVVGHLGYARLDGQVLGSESVVVHLRHRQWCAPPFR